MSIPKLEGKVHSLELRMDNLRSALRVARDTAHSILHGEHNAVTCEEAICRGINRALAEDESSERETSSITHGVPRKAAPGWSGDRFIYGSCASPPPPQDTTDDDSWEAALYTKGPVKLKRYWVASDGEINPFWEEVLGKVDLLEAQSTSSIHIPRGKTGRMPRAEFWQNNVRKFFERMGIEGVGHSIHRATDGSLTVEFRRHGITGKY